MLLAASKLGPQGIAIIVGILALAFGVIAAAAIHDRRRRRAIVEALDGMGMAVTAKPTRDQKDQLFAPFASSTVLKEGSRGLRWHAAGRVQGRNVAIIEHAHTVQSGKNRVVVIHTCVAAIGAASWPPLLLTGENFLNRLGEKLGAKADLKLENDEFNRRWRTSCADEGFAVAMLSPSVQQVLAEADRHEWWYFGGPSGMVCIGRRKALKAEQIVQMIERLNTAIDAMPAEARTGLGV